MRLSLSIFKAAAVLTVAAFCLFVVSGALSAASFGVPPGVPPDQPPGTPLAG